MSLSKALMWPAKTVDEAVYMTVVNAGLAVLLTQPAYQLGRSLGAAWYMRKHQDEIKAAMASLLEELGK